jgi:hypothetical protein
MTTGAKEVYEGTENPGPSLKDPLELLNPKQVALLRMLAGMLNSATLAPDVLDRLIAVKDEGTTDGVRTIQISAREKIPGSVRLELIRGTVPIFVQQKWDCPLMPGEKGTVPSIPQPDGYIPQSLSFNIAGTHGSVKFVAWQINAIAQDAQFQPPADLPRRQVDQSFLYTLFSTSLKFALGTAD